VRWRRHLRVDADFHPLYKARGTIHCTRSIPIPKSGAEFSLSWDELFQEPIKAASPDAI
jgi:hypothetical protein